ncbi:MAG: hypothetical protein AAF851_09080 [Myxococcota bacterium]
MRRLWTICVLLTACGSESEPSADSGNMGGVQRDTGPMTGDPDLGLPPTPGVPVVLRTAPEAGSLTTDMPSVQIVFSEPMALEAADFLAAEADGESLDLRALVNDTRIDVGFDERLPGTSTVTVTVGAGAPSTRGGQLAETFVLRFRVRGTAPIPPVLASELSPEPLGACPDPSPAVVQGMATLAEGLAGFGWSFETLHSSVAWSVPVVAATRWINDGARGEGVRVALDQVPRVDDCFVGALRGADSAGVLSVQGAFVDELATFDGLARPSDSAGDYPLDGFVDFPFTSAVWGLFANRGPGEERSWSPELRTLLENYEARLVPELRRALADLVHALGEAELLRTVALGDRADDLQAAADLVTRMDLVRSLTTGRWVVQPEAPLAVLLRNSNLENFDTTIISMAARRVAAASERVIEVLSGASTPELDPLEFDTPIGRVALHLQTNSDLHELAGDVALFIDAAGDDHYLGRIAANTDPRVPAAVVIDLGGNDRYGPDAYELTDPSLPFETVLGAENSFSQGFGLLGVGLLYDLQGDDLYRGAGLVQGVGFLGVGGLIDRAGSDRYDGTFMAQGTGQFGTGLLLDEEGEDLYVTFHNGQGVGRPRGQGLLLDRGGADEYLAVYIGHTDELPEAGRLLFPGGSVQDGRGVGYTHTEENGEVRVHNLSGSQGTGWGLRFDWFPEGAPTRAVWAGGFGALIDEGSEDDLHFADTLSIGQGFVYGLGLMHDDGGNDLYRAFWWAFGSGTHMGTGLFRDRAGDDDVMVTRFSAALGHDTGVSWYIDESGSDIYQGNITHGRSLDEGQAFFMDLGGVDFYRSPLSINYGICNHSFDSPVPGLARVGLFLDAGPEADFYETPGGAAANGSFWVQDPAGAGAASPTVKRGWGRDEN